MKTEARTYLKGHIAKDHLKEVFEYLLQKHFPLMKEDEERVRNLSGRFLALQRQIDADTHDHDTNRQERNRIREALLNLVDEISLTPYEQKQKQRTQKAWIIGAISYLLIGSVLLFVIFSPKAPIRITGRLMVDQLGFTHQQGSYNLGGSALEEANLSFFEELALEADSIALDADFSGTFSTPTPPSGPITLRPIAGSEGVVIPISGNLRLDDLPLEAGAQMAISRPEGEQAPRLIRLLISKSPSLIGTLSYIHKAQIDIEQVKVEGLPGHEEVLYPMGLKLIGPVNSPRNLRFSSYPDNLTLELQAKEELNIQGIGLQIEELEFYRKDENLDNQVPISTVLGGEIHIIEPGKDSLKTIRIKERQKLDLIGQKDFEVERLQIREEGLELFFTGSVRKISIGSSNKSYNPSWFVWLWHNYQLPIIGIGMLLLGFVFFLPIWLRKRIINIIKPIKEIVT